MHQNENHIKSHIYDQCGFILVSDKTYGVLMHSDTDHSNSGSVLLVWVKTYVASSIFSISLYIMSCILCHLSYFFLTVDYSVDDRFFFSKRCWFQLNILKNTRK